MLLKFNSHPVPGFYKDSGKLVTAKTKSGSSRFKVTAQEDTTSNGGGSSAYSGVSPVIDRYNPVRDRLDEGSVVEDWIPRDASGLDEMFRLMYHRDHIAGTIVDFIADSIWSDFELVGVQDPEIKKIYEDSMESLDVLNVMPSETRDFLVLGRTVSSLIYNKERGIFDDILSHDPSLIRITPIPIKGFDPKIDLVPSPAFRQFVESTDPRDVDARKVLPQAYLEAVQNSGGPSWASPIWNQRDANFGGIPLDPVTTLFNARRVFSYDYIGTSFFTRLITFWALEKALINATVTAARRRSRAIMHLKAGIDNLWEPSIEEIDSYVELFMQADEDPVGAIIGTRNGVDIAEVRAGQDIWKWGDEWEMLTQGKLRALGANDALLSGEATYSNQDTARQFFMERALQLREVITTRIFHNRIFPLLARIHNFVKISQACLDHGIRVKGDYPIDTPPSMSSPDGDYTSVRYGRDRNKLTQREALDIPDSQLVMPEIKWNKELVNNVDDVKMDIYERMEEKGIPITLRQWSAAGDIDLDAMVSGMDEDLELRKKIAKWRKEYDDANLEEEAKLDFVNSLRNLTTSKLKRAVGNFNPQIANFPYWDKKGRLGTLECKQFEEFITKMDPDSNKVHIFKNEKLLDKELFSHFSNALSVELAKYVLYKIGMIPKPNIGGNAKAIIIENTREVLNDSKNSVKAHRIASAVTSDLNEIITMGSSVKNNPLENMSKNLNGRYGLRDGISTESPNLFSGMT